MEIIDTVEVKKWQMGYTTCLKAND